MFLSLPLILIIHLRGVDTGHHDVDGGEVHVVPEHAPDLAWEQVTAGRVGTVKGFIVPVETVVEHVPMT